MFLLTRSVAQILSVAKVITILNGAKTPPTRDGVFYW